MVLDGWMRTPNVEALTSDGDSVLPRRFAAPPTVNIWSVLATVAENADAVPSPADPFLVIWTVSSRRAVELPAPWYSVTISIPWTVAPVGMENPNPVAAMIADVAVADALASFDE